MTFWVESTSISMMRSGQLPEKHNRYALCWEVTTNSAKEERKRRVGIKNSYQILLEYCKNTVSLNVSCVMLNTLHTDLYPTKTVYRNEDSKRGLLKLTKKPQWIIFLILWKWLKISSVLILIQGELSKTYGQVKLLKNIFMFQVIKFGGFVGELGRV